MNCDSIPRAWHTASFIKDKNLLVIFGGERTVDGCPECLDDIMVLDTGETAAHSFVFRLLLAVALLLSSPNIFFIALVILCTHFFG